jgi:hypothetical protein
MYVNPPLAVVKACAPRYTHWNMVSRERWVDLNFLRINISGEPNGIPSGLYLF